MPNFFEFTTVAAVVLILSWGATEIFRRWASKRKLFDVPNERSSHTIPTPRGGGVGIVFAVLAGGTAIAVGFPETKIFEYIAFGGFGFIALGALLIVAISWLDDIRQGLPPVVRLVVHSFAAGLVLIDLGGWTRVVLPIIGRIELGWIGIPVSFFWIISLVNVYNFMDGIDGIAGIQAVTAAMGWFLIGTLSHNALLSTVGIVIGFSSIGFLIHNWPPAKIFMGDIGSAFLGFVFAVMPLSTSFLFADLYTDRIPVAGFLMVAPFVVDATFTLLRRISRKEKLSQAHRSHLYQRLILTGLSHRTVMLLYLVLGFIGGVAGMGYVFLANRMWSDVLAVGAVLIILLIPLSLATKRERIAAIRSGDLN